MDLIRAWIYTVQLIVAMMFTMLAVYSAPKDASTRLARALEMWLKTEQGVAERERENLKQNNEI